MGRPEKMIVKPEKGAVAAFIILTLGLVADILYLIFSTKDEFTYAYFMLAILLMASVLLISPEALVAFELDKNGITQRCFLFSRRFEWSEFYYIGEHVMITGGCPHIVIRCLTKPLNKNMTGEQFGKTYPFPFKNTLAIEWRGEEFYRDFLYY